ncbi:glycerol kinase GlpK [Granulosicoccaceae sp. 1_MG-2023]|nr:glycerol kinase GlpK [Granulosicoccaceae sp. 1_MG-2023]
MEMSDYILAIDQGTTSSRAIVFDQAIRAVASGQEEFEQHFPQSGWVEHKATDLLDTALRSCHAALREAGLSGRDIRAIGITNQRETTLVWDKHSGEAVYPAIVWQDRRTARWCDKLRANSDESRIRGKTGLLLDPYFSASKIAWILDNVDGARARAEAGDLLFGTVDSWLIWHLTGGRHVTDATNAARTLLYNIRDGHWDEALLDLFGIPASMLPEVLDSADDFGHCKESLFGKAIPICGVAGDQQAATVGQACFQPGMLKSTYGTGTFAVLNTGKEIVTSGNRLLSTIAYQLNGQPVYALEGSIFIAGAAVQWLRDGLGIINQASETGALARQADPNQNVYLVPAFTGLGAPYWDADARGALYGMTRNTGPAEIAKATLDAVAYQTRDLIEAMRQDWKTAGGVGEEMTLRVDGGMVQSNQTLQGIADILGAPVDRPETIETTALGAAYLAGLQSGLYPDPDSFAQQWRCERRFEPQIDKATRDARYRGWLDCVRRTRSNT